MSSEAHDHDFGEVPERSAARTALANGMASSRRAWLNLGLPAKLLLLTAVFVMLAEVLIFVPSIANYRINWLTDRLAAARLAALAAEAVKGGEVPKPLRDELLHTAKVKAVAWRRNHMHRLVLPPTTPVTVDVVYDLRPEPDQGFITGLGQRMMLIGQALDTMFFRSGERTMRVIGPLGNTPTDYIEIVVPEAPLKAVMQQFGLNILGLSIIISLIAAALVYLALSRILVQPMMRITRNMLAFSKNPEDPERIIVPSDRADEIGTTERELADMQRQLSGLLLQKNRLAQLGLAVSKINHDLRNMLANAQLLSDRLGSIPDPTVQRFAPKLIASLDRAINFCNDSLRFGRAEEAAPRRQLMLLKPLVEEVGEGLGLSPDSAIRWQVEIENNLRIDSDPDHLYRVLSNLCRNAVQATENLPADNEEQPTITIRAWRTGRRVILEVRDNGPGVPPKAKENLFRAFAGSQRKGGSGLGLAIAHELITAHGGSLELLDSDKGAVFHIEMPDRGT